ncbi:hypothetical protein MKJ01_02610 [Chryseobacterium sp. SSA4.19]|uniref:hypothetical protein n=1 Tax=Chryseobacterium sp. SSA4.19 TaxID=2919915 RepID=UPI001F4ECD3C|nr:hypothetical protein [Chryseobacterium sp. SSA4.19]MCJ8152653.1 hypothetical protein [Chryseobacterium sp. SSA4.19]
MADFAGIGRKRPLINVYYENLLLDPENPRLPQDVQGKSQKDVIYALYKLFDIEELAYSMTENGYFDEEPLVAIPEQLPVEFIDFSYDQLKENAKYIEFIQNPSTKFIVLEGNRRLSTIKLLLDNNLKNEFKIRTFPIAEQHIVDDIQSIPVIIYPKRSEVLPYLGVRHISGIKKWEPYAKARYVANMVKEGFTIDEIQKQVGDRSNSARKIYLSYQLIETIKDEFDLDTSKAENLFSYLLLATGQGAVKEFIGLDKRLQNVDLNNPIPSDKLDNLKDLFSWMFGEDGKLPVIQESRDITAKLAPVLRKEHAVNILRETRNLEDAYDMSDGEDELLKNNLSKVNRLLSISLGLFNENNKDIVFNDVIKLKETVDKILLINKITL